MAIKTISPGKFGIIRRKITEIKERGIMAKRKRRQIFIQEEKLLEKNMINLATSSKESERVAAADALGNLRDKRALPDLIRAVEKDNSLNVRGKAIVALGTIADERAVKPLIQALQKETDPMTVHKICWALGNTGGREAIQALELKLVGEKLEKRNLLIIEGAENAITKINKRLEQTKH